MHLLPVVFNVVTVIMNTFGYIRVVIKYQVPFIKIMAVITLLARIPTILNAPTEWINPAFSSIPHLELEYLILKPSTTIEN